VGSIDDELIRHYQQLSEKMMTEEAKKRIAESVDPDVEQRLRGASLKMLAFRFRSNGDSNELVGALFARLGIVRAALVGHGGGIIVRAADIGEGGDLEFVLGLDGACIACGAAPSTLVGIRADLLADEEVAAVRFEWALLESFDSLSQEFLTTQTDIEFVDTAA